jgi:hypothetical protein
MQRTTATLSSAGINMNIAIPICVIFTLLLAFLTGGLVRRHRNKRRAAAAAVDVTLAESTETVAVEQVTVRVQPETSV